MRKALWAIAIAGTLFPSVGIAQPPTGAEDVLKTWEERQNRTQSIRAEWTEEFTETEGSLTPLLGLKDHAPPRDTKFTNSAELVIDEGKIRFRHQRHLWSIDKQRYEPDDSLRVFDGETGRDLSIGGSVDYPFGIIRKEKRPMDATIPEVFAILITYRATHAALSPIRQMPFIATGPKSVVQGKVCSELEVRKSGLAKRKMWVDPASEFIVLREVIVEGNGARRQIDIQYRKDAYYGWVPSSWVISSYLKGGLLHRSVRARMTLLELNPSVKKSEFNIDWPARTYVRDEKSGQDFIQNGDSGVRLVSKQERTKTYEELASTPGPSMIRTRLFSWPVLIVGAVLLGAGAWIAARAWRKRPGREA